MSISIIKNPTILVNGHKSKWFPAHQPITFEIQRFDANVTLKNNASNFNEIHFYLNIPVPSTVKAGQKFTYIRGESSQILTIKSVQGNIIKIVAITGILGGTLGNINFTDAYKGYFIETKISFVDNTTYKEIGTIKSKPNDIGKAKVSVQELLATKCINQNNFPYNAINLHQFGEGSRFNVQVRESYNGVAGNFSALSKTDALYYTNSALQIQEKYGYNMANYVPTLDSGRVDKAKFQSVFKRPTYFVGYPFSLSFIYSDNMLNYQLVRKEDTKDINGNIVANTSSNLSTASRDWANRLMLKQDYTSDIKTVDVWLEANEVTVQNPYVQGGYSSGYYRPYQPQQEFDFQYSRK